MFTLLAIIGLVFLWLSTLTGLDAVLDPPFNLLHEWTGIATLYMYGLVPLMAVAAGILLYYRAKEH